MKNKIKAGLLIAFGAFLGITFPEATAEFFQTVKDAPYAEYAASIKSAAITSYDYVLGLFVEAPAAQ